MEVLDKILAWIKGIIIDWRIGTVGLVGFTTVLIITQDTNLIIGIAIAVSMIVVDAVDKNYAKWHDRHLKKKWIKTVSSPKYQQEFFDNCSNEEMKILTQLYRNYPKPYPLSRENAAVDNLSAQFAIKIMNKDMGRLDIDAEGNRTAVFMYVLQPWVKTWLDSHKERLKRNTRDNDYQ